MSLDGGITSDKREHVNEVKWPYKALIFYMFIERPGDPPKPGGVSRTCEG